MMRAGAAQVDITPAKGIQIGGDIGRRRPAETIADPLYARALVLDDGHKRLCIVALDLISISDACAERIRQEAARRCGFERDAVLVHAIQTHAAPGMGGVVEDRAQPWVTDDLWWLFNEDPRYQQPAFEGVLRAIEQAHTQLQPVGVSIGRRTDGRVAFNRRFVMRDGQGRCHPPRCDPNILHCEGPIDPEVAVMVLRRPCGQGVAAVLHHTCHPCHFYPLTVVSAGWPGAWCDAVAKQLGPGTVALVLNGFCGNVHHTNHLDPTQVDDHRQMGAKLAETTAAILAAPMHDLGDASLDFAARTLRLAMRPIPPEVFEQSKRLLDEHPTPLWLDEAKTRVDWAWWYAVDRMLLHRLQQRQRHCDYPISALRIGDVAILGADGEPFVEAQLQIKLRSPAAFTLAAHGCGMDAGYIPTAAALARGGYETDIGTLSKLAPDALDTITGEFVKLLERLFAPRQA